MLARACAAARRPFAVNHRRSLVALNSRRECSAAGWSLLEDWERSLEAYGNHPLCTPQEVVGKLPAEYVGLMLYDDDEFCSDDERSLREVTLAAVYEIISVRWSDNCFALHARAEDGDRYLTNFTVTPTLIEWIQAATAHGSNRSDDEFITR